MRASVNISLDQNLLNQIDTLRGREKRSTFVEHLIRLGLESYMQENPAASSLIKRAGKERRREWTDESEK